jgi:translation initiation factor IF-2
MTDNNDDKTGMAGKKTLTLKPSGFSQGTVRQDMGRGRTKAVVVETRKRRINRPEDEKVITPVQQTQPAAAAPRQPESQTRTQQPVAPPPQARPRPVTVLNDLSAGEMEARRRALAEAQIRDAEEAKQRAEQEARRKVGKPSVSSANASRRKPVHAKKP